MHVFCAFSYSKHKLCITRSTAEETAQHFGQHGSKTTGQRSSREDTIRGFKENVRHQERLMEEGVFMQPLNFSTTNKPVASVPPPLSACTPIRINQLTPMTTHRCAQSSCKRTMHSCLAEIWLRRHAPHNHGVHAQQQHLLMRQGIRGASGGPMCTHRLKLPWLLSCELGHGGIERCRTCQVVFCSMAYALSFLLRHACCVLVGFRVCGCLLFVLELS